MKAYDSGLLELNVDGMGPLIAHATFTAGERDDWIIDFTIWTKEEEWDTWVFVEGSYRRRDLTVYYNNEWDWVRMGGFLFDDLPQGLAALHQPDDEDADVFFDSVVRILNHTDFLSISPLPDGLLKDHPVGEPYRLSESGWSEVNGLPLWRPGPPPSPDAEWSRLPEKTFVSDVVRELAEWLQKAKQEDNWVTNMRYGGYIQVGLRLDRVRAEVSSGAELGGSASLTPGQVRQIKEIGWRHPVLGTDDFPNYWYEWKLGDLDKVDIPLAYSVTKMVKDTLEYVFELADHERP
ncbi:hypothetical protein [Intrasporangium sp. DVR]|uniref:TY-Chap domain-containing protein n=1 Tax=Intrasporangium sp. DVR TaxID=3127867 RepID=UPI00333F10C6